MCKQSAPERCEAKTGCTRPVYSHNETVHDKNTKAVTKTKTKKESK